MEEVADEIRALGRRALVNSTDIAKVEQVDRMVKRTYEEFGQDMNATAGVVMY